MAVSAGAACVLVAGRCASFVRAGASSWGLEEMVGAGRLDTDGAADDVGATVPETVVFSVDGAIEEVALSSEAKRMMPTAAAVPARTVIGMIFLMAIWVLTGCRKD